MFTPTHRHLVATSLLLAALVTITARAETPRFPYRTLPADIVVLKDLPPEPEPQLRGTAVGPRPGVVKGTGLGGAAPSVVENPDGGGCTGPRQHKPGRPACPGPAMR